ncbi:hypothetical protein A2631_05710 [Candidatus Daviesbacteria bacterium RIFCSPHIGHO2_01_FULL_44_29]|uniref:Sigma-54 factor interaction domain-containing protein n=1 Tax=Candidatus Daviesbacteria bacterium RIFCSPHIGHO2_02_FULL_43_12 TaxID=1797776 RepID=A0A1F5KJ59_9BACT|nr:MAG: hypothetical protein A2631_05710 [Candidatus Daviesbacteria bacterium RIFCSPHIGHO2_01_FULL_44_29]OGE39490.1 MAG: hypothetical protein A3E86_04055 [Candidatus Daviesbacteria bacterium RIFCSPHIGHO2_12_FULL_47_45]OGE40651.1 MAG: hypothetical protein A3D25_05840 [Candidatus Daviesbacteria bacterium RIFCSPHIGHO2_02_FULL_43_12]OGE69853.1 MAG: hypothetical protein A3B55_05585 [Candidatus Daviesbacteria bacterium RIFCSPLOWO2_01_FULL_43_15]
MFLPLRLIKFWYIDSPFLFFRSWLHLISFLEEDLAVGLMLKLLFVPLFHDGSITGQILSFFFRSIRIIVGLFAYLVATILLAMIAVSWLIAPIAILTPIVYVPWAGLALTIFGIGLFTDQVIFYPPQKLWHIKEAKNLWKATKVSKRQLTWVYFAKSFEIKQLLASLELTNHDFVGFNPQISPQLLDKIYALGKAANAKYLTDSYFFIAMLHFTPGIETELLKLNLKLEDFDQALFFAEKKKTSWRMVFLWDEEFGVAHLKGLNRGWLGAPTPALDAISTDLTKEASRIGFEDFLGRKNVVSEAVNILSQKTDRNVCLVGPAGTGKSTLVAHLAQMIIAGNAPEALATKRLVTIELSKLLSGVKTEGDVAQKLESALEEAKFGENVVIFLDEIQNFATGDAGANFNIFSLLLPHLESNTLQFLASTEPENYTKIIEKQSFFARSFHRLDIPPASSSETLEILQNRAIQLERKEKIQFSFIALQQIVSLSEKLIHDRVLPDRALSIFNEAIRLNKNKSVGSQEIKQVLEKRVNVPLVELDTAARVKLLDLENQIHTHFVGQEAAVSAIAQTLRRAATDIRDSNRPIGSFLFVGPTGVGKTELAKTLCEVYFSKESRESNVSNAASSDSSDSFDSSIPFFRFDMSEYQTQESVSRLIGDSVNPGLLTEAVRHTPYCLILLDEFEKADPKLRTLFLQVLDDGRLTDVSGKTVDFTNTIIIATSNAGALQIAQGLSQGKTIDQLKPMVTDELLKEFRPELVNRFDEVAIFRPLTKAEISQIVQDKLTRLQADLKNKGYLVKFSPQLVRELAQKGFDPVLGARPLRRLMQDTLEANLSKMILEDKLQKGVATTISTLFP